MSGCPNLGEFRAMFRWKGVFGPGYRGLQRPVVFCGEHARSFKHALPDGAEWLDDPDRPGSD
jgi:hypothetical protein